MPSTGMSPSGIMVEPSASERTIAMPGAILLVSALIVNYARHRRNESTICMTFRRTVPRPIGAVFLTLVFSWLFPHVLLGYPARLSEAIRDEVL